MIHGHTRRADHDHESGSNSAASQPRTVNGLVARVTDMYTHTIVERHDRTLGVETA
jgi:hypothetical protein